MSATERSSARAVVADALAHPRVPWLLAATFVGVGVEATLSRRFLHDEGLLTYHLASMLFDGGWPLLFFQKVRPVLSTVYAPISQLGFAAFSVAHVLVAALAIPMIAAVARAAGHTRPNFAALLLATSSLLVATAAGGHSNADAVFGITLGLYLLVVRRRELAAGVVIGALVLVRSEIAIFLLALAAWRLLERRPQFLYGLPIVPLVYALAGVAYHGDLLWMLHYPPTLMGPVEDADWVADASFPSRVADSTEVLLAVCAPVGLLVMGSIRDRDRFHRTLFAGAVAFILAIRGFPAIGLFNFDESPRYALCVLPFLALDIGGSLDRWDRRPPSAAFGMALVVLVILAGTATERWLVVGAGSTWAAVLALASRERAALAGGLTLAMALAGPAVLRAQTGLLADRERVREITGALAQLEIEGEAVVTNHPLLARWTEDAGLDLDVRLLMHRDMIFEVHELTNPQVGQTEAVLAQMEANFYARPLPFDADGIQNLPPRAIVVLEEDPRLDAVLADATGGRDPTVVAEGRGYRILRMPD